MYKFLFGHVIGAKYKPHQMEKQDIFSVNKPKPCDKINSINHFTVCATK